MDPDYAMAYQNLGVVYFKLGQRAESRASFEQAIELYEVTDPPQAQQLKVGIRELGL